MKIKSLLSLALLLVSVTGHGQLLWRVSGNGAASPSYVFGSHHIAPVQVLDTLSGFSRAMAECAEVWGEVDCDSMNTPQVHARVSQSMVAPPDSTLSSLFSPEAYAMVERSINSNFGSMGVSLKQFDKYKPVAITTVVQALWAVEDFGALAQSIDSEVQDRAREAGKPVRPLESIDFQINILYNAPLSQQAADLLEMCRDGSTAKDDLHRVNEAYLAQDLATILEITTKAASSADRLAVERLIYDRNRRWAAILPQVMRQRPVLVCVGAGHLAGSQGLVELLRQAGFTVEPVWH